MKQFVAIVHHDQGSAYGLTFPDAPGCFSASDDLYGIVAAGSEALSLHFEDEDEVPEPRDLAALQDEVRQAMAEGAILSVLIPFVGRSGRVERVNISLDAAVLSAIDREAEKRKLTRSAFIAVATISEIEQRPATVFVSGHKRRRQAESGEYMVAGKKGSGLSGKVMVSGKARSGKVDVVRSPSGKFYSTARRKTPAV